MRLEFESYITLLFIDSTRLIKFYFRFTFIFPLSTQCFPEENTVPDRWCGLLAIVQCMRNGDRRAKTEFCTFICFYWTASFVLSVNYGYFYFVCCVFISMSYPQKVELIVSLTKSIISSSIVNKKNCHLILPK